MGDKFKWYADADWAGSYDDRKSYTGYMFMLAGGSITWESRKQQTVALSSTEAKYMALSSASKEAVYLKKCLFELGFKHVIDKPIELNGDNISSHQLVKNSVFHARSKNIDLSTKINYLQIYLRKI